MPGPRTSIVRGNCVRETSLKRRNKIVQEIARNVHVANVFFFYAIIAIKHDFQYINIRQVPLEVLKTAASGLGFHHLPRDLANVNARKPCLIPILQFFVCGLCNSVVVSSLFALRLLSMPREGCAS